MNLLIGEPSYRNKQVTNTITGPLQEFFFGTLGLNTAMASVLAHNAPMIHYLLKSGWKLDQTRKQAAKSNADGTMLDVCSFSLSREAWCERKKETLAQSNSR